MMRAVRVLWWATSSVLRQQSLTALLQPVILWVVISADTLNLYVSGHEQLDYLEYFLACWS